VQPGFAHRWEDTFILSTVALGDTRLQGAELQHINARMIPNPDKHKDAITHSLVLAQDGYVE